MERGLLMMLPALVTAWFLHLSRGSASGEQDFSVQYWVAGWKTLHGLSPYPSLHGPIMEAVAFPYPATTAIFFVPFALVPRGISTDLFTAICLAAPLISLRLLDVRDWRLYGFVLLVGPVVNGWETGNLTLLLMLGLALLWRFRSHPLRAGLATAAVVSLKLFLWPVAVWLLATRRYLATAYALATGVVLATLSWAILGWDQIERFLHVNAAIVRIFRAWGYSVSATLMQFGVGQTAATGFMIAVSALFVLACFRLARQGFEGASFVAMIGLVLAASPVVWVHYFALLVLPLAILKPALSKTWLLLLPFWVCVVSGISAELSAFALLDAAVICMLLVRSGRHASTGLQTAGDYRPAAASPG
jgi:hypothetical protein